MRTVFWQDNQVQMIDQRLLPGEFVIVTFATVQEVARSIREMYVRGAPAIGATGAYGMVVAAQSSRASDVAHLLSDLRAAKAVLDAARPTAVNLSWATARLLAVAEEAGAGGALVDEVRAALLTEAEALADQDVEINRRME
jgi:methylthioribose-1-phosphate isomerase